jgi:hypothetical protein
MTVSKTLGRGLLGFVALFALFGATVAATADHDNESRFWLFGDCGERQGPQVVAASHEEDGCNGFGIVLGDLPDDRALVAELLNNVPTPNYFIVKHAYAFKVGSQFVPPVTAGDPEGECKPEKVTADQLPEITGTPGLWLVWFSIVVCDEPI